MIINEQAELISNNNIAKNTFRAFLYAPQIANHVNPGQFINILPNSEWGYVMRRPMSIASCNNDIISIIYKAIGPGTTIMSNWNKGETIDIIGPLGNQWKIITNKLPVLIGGGVGIAPILYLHNKLNSLGVKHAMIMGARTKNEHFIEHNNKKSIIMSTDDGSYGVKGTVLDALKSITNKTSDNQIHIYCCGPSPMMSAIKSHSELESISSSLALETIMACGFGICQGCTVEFNTKSTNDTYRKKYGLACIDGPIFNSKDIKQC